MSIDQSTKHGADRNSQKNIIECLELSKEYEGLKAVNEVTLEVPPSAVVALVGPNGAGKSTWMRMVAGLLEPSSGAVKVCGIDVAENPREAHTKLGFLPDFFGLYDELSVYEYLEYFARCYGIEAQAIRPCVDRVLEQVQLAHKMNEPIPALSRGMRQRLAIARSLVNDPPLLLLDEPASGLDPEARFELQQLFRTLSNDAQKTLVVSSHILTELEAYSTHVAMLHRGRLMAYGRVEELRASALGLRRVRLRALNDGQRSLEHALKARENDALRIESLESLRPELAPPNSSEVSVDFRGSDAELAALVRALVSEGVALIHVETLVSSMQEAYMKHMKGHSA
jgi:ABC-2 type transport system ATP-binding protein